MYVLYYRVFGKNATPVCAERISYAASDKTITFQFQIKFLFFSEHVTCLDPLSLANLKIQLQNIDVGRIFGRKGRSKKRMTNIE